MVLSKSGLGLSGCSDFGLGLPVIFFSGLDSVTGLDSVKVSFLRLLFLLSAALAVKRMAVNAAKVRARDTNFMMYVLLLMM
jgi:hypothetical protein